MFQVDGLSVDRVRPEVENMATTYQRDIIFPRNLVTVLTLVSVIYQPTVALASVSKLRPEMEVSGLVPSEELAPEVGLHSAVSGIDSSVDGENYSDKMATQSHQPDIHKFVAAKSTGSSKKPERVPKRSSWRSSRIQAAWGKRSSGQPETQRRSSWNQIGRQAWGKRADLGNEDALLERLRRKWGVGSAKAAWGKRH